jgi:hypothetical protein
MERSDFSTAILPCPSTLSAGKWDWLVVAYRPDKGWVVADLVSGGAIVADAAVARLVEELE